LRRTFNLEIASDLLILVKLHIRSMASSVGWAAMAANSRQPARGEAWLLAGQGCSYKDLVVHPSLT
jgi:hypothetical protein